MKFITRLRNQYWLWQSVPAAVQEEFLPKAITFAGPVDKIIPVNAYIPGCPPKPEAIIAGIVKLVNKSEGKCAKGLESRTEKCRVVREIVRRD